MSEQIPPSEQPTQPASQPLYPPPPPSGPLPPQPLQQPYGTIPQPSSQMPRYTQPLPRPSGAIPPPPPSPTLTKLSRQTLIIVGLVVLIFFCSSLAYAVGKVSGGTVSFAQASPGVTIIVETPTPLPETPTPTPTPTATPTPGTPTPTPTPSPTPKPPGWTTIQTFKGVNNKKTSVFTISQSDWRLVWTCSLGEFGESFFGVTVYTSDGTYYDLAVNNICKSGSTHDVAEEHDSGSFYLAVEADDPWTIQIQVFE